MKIKFLVFCFAGLLCGNVFAQQDSIVGKSLDDIVVTGTRTAVTARNLPVTISVVDRVQLAETQRVNILPTLVEQVPGLFVTQRGLMGFGVSNGAAGGINVRGIAAGGGQLLVLIDGHPQYNGIYGHSIADAYQTMMAERVEVLRGPASVLYGSNAMGGVINIVTRGMKQDGVNTHVHVGAGSYGTVQVEASNMIRKGGFSSSVAGQYGRSDNHRPRMGFEQYGGYVKLGYDFNEKWNIFADVDLTHFNSSYPGSVSAPMYEADQWITRGVATLAVENHGERTSGRLSVYDNFGRHKINDGYAEGATPQMRLFRSKDALTGVSFYQSIDAWVGSRITVGVDYQHIYGNAYYTSRETGEILETQNKQSGKANMNEIAGYVDLRQTLADWLTIDAGIRLDNHSVSGSEWVPQIGIVARPTNNAEVRLMASKGFRNPTMREMYLYPPSNEDLEAERLWNYELAWKQRIANGRFTYGINLFLIDGDNMIQTVNRQNVNTGEIKNRGAELEASFKVSECLTLNTNHSWLHMDNHVVGAPEYKGYLGATFHCNIWNASAGLQQVSGLFKAVGTENDPKENFTLLNINVGCQVMKHLQIWAKGENLLAQDYEINAGYPMPHATFMAGVNLKF
ncbi:MAG: TonB-dependent receptor [Bacteroidales bacterium]|nr:TonB-dependent receptor [Bacteroidales bacterium]